MNGTTAIHHCINIPRAWEFHGQQRRGALIHFTVICLPPLRSLPHVDDGSRDFLTSHGHISGFGKLPLGGKGRHRGRRQNRLTCQRYQHPAAALIDKIGRK